MPPSFSAPLSPWFYRFTAVAAALSVCGVLVAQFVLAGYAVDPGPDAALRLYLHPTFRAQEAVILAQVMCMFVALWGAAAAAWHRAPALAATALLFVVLWQVLELVPRAVDVFAAAGRWAPAWEAAATDAERVRWAALLAAWQDVWGSLGIVRRIVWGAAHLLLGAAFVRWPGTARWIGALFLFNAVRLLPRTFGALAGVGWLASFGGGRWWFVAGTLPLFALMAWWLWRQSSER